MMVKKLLPVFCGLASLSAHGADPAAALGLKRAAASPLQWEIREASHPALGNIRFAFLKKPVATQVSTATLSTNIYVSCERSRRRIAIEIANTTGPADPDGLQPAVVPRLLCNRPVGNTTVKEELNASWEFNKLGDALSRGLATFPLRECASIEVKQEVLLPADWGIRSARIEFEFSPYAREVDEIFVACGEKSAYGPAAPAGKASPRAPLKPSRSLGAAWTPAYTVSEGRTNVRARPSVDAPLVVRLDPGNAVLVQQVDAHWWRIKPRAGTARFEGFVRDDRLDFR